MWPPAEFFCSGLMVSEFEFMTICRKAASGGIPNSFICLHSIGLISKRKQENSEKYLTLIDITVP